MLQESFGRSILVPAMVVVVLQIISSHAIARASRCHKSPPQPRPVPNDTNNVGPNHATLAPVSSWKPAMLILTVAAKNTGTPHAAKSESAMTWLETGTLLSTE